MTSSSSPLRFGLIGPRRVRQGLGPYFARYLEDAGARLVAFAVHAESSLAPAAAELAANLGHAVAGHVGAERLLAAERLDAVVIASPIEAHAEALRAALAHGVHVLCEKPLLSPWPGADAAVAEIAADFAAHGLLLRVNTQWPWTLPAFFGLHRHLAPPHAPRRFAMHLSPGSRGAAMVPDALPHPLSMLQVLCPDPAARVERVRHSWPGDDRELIVEFFYTARQGTIDCRVALRHCPEQPRPAGYAIDGCGVERRIVMPGYRLFFDAAHGSIEVADPLSALVTDFVAALRRGPPLEIDATLPAQMRMLAALAVSPEGPHRPKEGRETAGPEREGKNA
jgi:predicted dehydrogenase